MFLGPVIIGAVECARMLRILVGGHVSVEWRGVERSRVGCISGNRGDSRAPSSEGVRIVRIGFLDRIIMRRSSTVIKILISILCAQIAHPCDLIGPQIRSERSRIGGILMSYHDLRCPSGEGIGVLPILRLNRIIVRRFIRPRRNGLVYLRVIVHEPGDGIFVNSPVGGISEVARSTCCYGHVRLRCSTVAAGPSKEVIIAPVGREQRECGRLLVIVRHESYCEGPVAAVQIIRNGVVDTYVHRTACMVFVIGISDHFVINGIETAFNSRRNNRAPCLVIQGIVHCAANGCS